VQVDSIKTRVESAPGFSLRLKLKCDEPLSDFAFNFNLRRYTEVESETPEGHVMKALYSQVNDRQDSAMQLEDHTGRITPPAQRGDSASEMVGPDVIRSPRHPMPINYGSKIWMRERRFRVYREAPGFRPGPLKTWMMTCHALSVRPYLATYEDTNELKKRGSKMWMMT
jgi:hypothetical protein